MRNTTGRYMLAGVAPGLAAGAAGRADAGPITLSVELDGVTIIAFSSTSRGQVVSADISAVNSALSAVGSAYQFTSLSADCNFGGASTGGFLADPTPGKPFGSATPEEVF